LGRDFVVFDALVAILVTGLVLGSTSAIGQQKSLFESEPISIVMGGYGPPSTSFSLGLKRIGDRLEEKFGDAVNIRYVYNVMDVGFSGGSDLKWLVEAGILTLGYLTMADGVPELELAALPFLFPDSAIARAAMDGKLGSAAALRIEAAGPYKVLGYFENGFRHVSNNVRPIQEPDDLKGLTIRILPVQARIFEALGATPHAISLLAAIDAIKEGTIDGQENPLANTVTYGIYPYQRFHTITNHSYLSRPIFVHRPSFEAWPEALQVEIEKAAKDAVMLQRELHDQEERAAFKIIETAGGVIHQLTPEARAKFIQSAELIYIEARTKYSNELLSLVNLL